jgi:hypothetical protein
MDPSKAGFGVGKSRIPDQGAIAKDPVDGENGIFRGGIFGDVTFGDG